MGQPNTRLFSLWPPNLGPECRDSPRVLAPWCQIMKPFSLCSSGSHWRVSGTPPVEPLWPCSPAAPGTVCGVLMQLALQAAPAQHNPYQAVRWFLVSAGWWAALPGWVWGTAGGASGWWVCWTSSGTWSPHPLWALLWHSFLVFPK